MGDSTQLGTACLCIVSEGLLSVRVRGRHNMTLEKHDMESMWQRLTKHVDLEKPTAVLVKRSWDALNANVSRTNISSTNTESCLNH